MISDFKEAIINYYFLQPIEFAFFYLIPLLVLLALGCTLWLLYWLYEEKPKLPDKLSKRILTAAVTLSILALFCATFGYLIMYAGNKSLSAELGFGLVIVSMVLFPVVCGLFITYFKKKRQKPIKTAVK